MLKTCTRKNLFLSYGTIHIRSSIRALSSNVKWKTRYNPTETPHHLYDVLTFENTRRYAPLDPLKISREIPEFIKAPDYSVDGQVRPSPPHIVIKTSKEIEVMKKAGEMARRMLVLAGSLVRPGITTLEIDETIYKAMISHQIYPSCLRYRNYPNCICTSINNVVCHGIPDSRPLKDGDIVNIDLATYIDGYHGDCSASFYVGEVDEIGGRLVETSKQSLEKAIEKCGPFVPFSVIGETIEPIARQNGFSVVKRFTGHGIGKYFHELPFIYHFKNNLVSDLMLPGMIFTIEPMINEGLSAVDIWHDGWTVVTRDNSRSAQFEHTLLITEHGCEVLT